MLNQYGNISFEWGGRGPIAYDCIGLAGFIRQQHNARAIDFTQLDWVYKKHPTLEASPPCLVHQLAQILGNPIDLPEHLAIAIMENRDGRSNIGTVVGESIVSFGGDRVRVVPIDRVRVVGYYSIADALLVH